MADLFVLADRLESFAGSIRKLMREIEEIYDDAPRGMRDLIDCDPCLSALDDTSIREIVARVRAHAEASELIQAAE